MPQVQSSALEVLPLAPTHNVTKLFTEGELGKHVVSCLQSSMSEVRTAAVTCAAHLLSNQALLGQLASSGTFLAVATQWVEALGNALMDSAHAVCAAAHAAMQRMLQSVAASGRSDTAVLQGRLAGMLCQRVVKSLGTVLEHAQLLSAAEQVLVALHAAHKVTSGCSNYSCGVCILKLCLQYIQQYVIAPISIGKQTVLHSR